MKKLKGLAKKTEKLLLKLSRSKLLEDFTFVSGSALAFHLEHRLSEDIDLFAWQQEIDKEKIVVAIRELELSFRIMSGSSKQINIIAENVNLTFFAQGWDLLKDREHITGNLYVAPLNILAAMKINTLFLRARYRDYYDLYVLNKEVFSFTELFAIGKNMMPELSMKLFQTSLVYTKDVKDNNINHLSPKYKTSLEQIEAHFRKEIETWIKKQSQS